MQYCNSRLKLQKYCKKNCLMPQYCNFQCFPPYLSCCSHLVSLYRLSVYPFQDFSLCISMLNFARQLSVVDNHLKTECFVHGIECTIAFMLNIPLQTFPISIESTCMPTLVDYPGVSLRQTESPTLLYGSPNLLDKTKKCIACKQAPSWRIKHSKTSARSAGQ